jgi:NAD(P)-dependent dehydrogenase (short-subunit alcohol dehydrogenase family)
MNKELENQEKFHFLLQDISESDKLYQNVYNFLKDEELLDLVVLNAGIMNGVKDLQETTLEEIKEVMDINVWANKIIIEVILNTVKDVHQVVAISSGASLSGSRGWNAYALSKATLNMLIDLYSKEYSECHFCALAPGLIETGMQEYIHKLPSEFEKKYPVVKKLKAAYGTSKMPDPVEAAKIIAKGIVKAKSYQSGQFLDVRQL